MAKNRTLKTLLEQSIEKYAHKPALGRVDEEPITYEQMGEQVQTFSKVLHECGIMQGDKVAILSENDPHWGITFFAITTMGAVVVPILPDFHTNEVHHILRHSEAKAIVISQKQFAKLENMEVADLQNIFLIEDFSLIPPETEQSRLQQVLQQGQLDYLKIRQKALKKIKILPSEVREDDPASIIYTSGTTGHSKGVMLSHKNLVFDALATLKIQEVGSNDRLISVLPLSHSYECTIGFLIPMIRGAAVYYLKKPPIARILMPALQKIKPTMLLTVPLIIEKIFKTKVYPQLTASVMKRILYKFPLTRKFLHKIAVKKIYATFGGQLHFFGIGGALLSPETELFLREGKFPYAIGYGLTETSPLIAGTDARITRYRSTGKVIPGVEVKLADKNEKGEGEILVRGDNVMLGYFKDKARTKQSFTKDGWFRTGDLAKFDKDGYLYIKGRRKNMIVGPSGENIYPEEIEANLNKSDYVLESLVYEDNGLLTARVYLNYEELDKEMKNKHISDSKTKIYIENKLQEIRRQVNANVSNFSKIKRIKEQPEPFEKTPTKKIKRYLYV